jgi:hypothetical protein
VAINQNADLKPVPLAQALYGNGSPDFKPDFLQVAQAKAAIDNESATVTVDISTPHMDDFWDLRGAGKAGGKSADGLDIYWYPTGDTAQPLFRVDDGIGDGTDPQTFTSPMRIYYYKDGVVRVYVLTADTAFLSGRQPQNDAWAQVYSDFGRVDPSPTKWEIGQPEQDAAAQQMAKLGITVLRFQPKDQPKGNFFTGILDWLFSLMKRKQG